MHTGTVVAGIVGKQKYSYDLWGDVVNTASRMESAGMPDKIHVTEAVKIRLSDDYMFDELGIIELKGKGNVNSYVLTEKKSGRE
jgi:class 3 adenylate cyclase